MAKYGVENPLMNDIVKEKMKNNNMKKYGVESYMSTKEFRKSSIDFFDKNKNEILEKIKNTNLERYGVKNVFERCDIKQKIINTNLERYGVEYPSQNEEIFLKSQKKRFKIEKYKDSDIIFQGTYEKDFLDNFFYIIEIKRAMSFSYVFDNKKRYYHPDYYLPNFNLIVEIKSKYIFELEFDQNISKKQSCLDNGYNYIFIIDKDYTEFEKLLIIKN